MARSLAAASLAAVLAFAVAPVAAGAPGGIGPPDPVTDSGRTINEIYWVVFTACAIVFVLVESALILFIVRFRRRRSTPAEAEGPQIHGNTRLEIIWTLVPAAALVAIAVYMFARTPAVLADDSSDKPLVVRVEAHQFYWQYVYPNGAVSLDTLRLPVDRPVKLELISWDVNHSWWVPQLTGKRDALPGQKNTLSFTPSRTGSFEGYCAELCGVQHTVMHTRVEVMEESAYTSWVEQAAGGADLGRETWGAACAKCHGADGEGDVGPPIAGNGTLTNRQALIGLLSEGQDTPEIDNYMPPVGLGWKGSQYDALIEYVQSRPALSQPTGGGNGG